MLSAISSELFSELLMLLVAVSGLIFGFLLLLISPEESKPGKKYFLWLQKSLFVLIPVITVLFLGRNNVVNNLVNNIEKGVVNSSLNGALWLMGLFLLLGILLVVSYTLVLKKTTWRSHSTKSLLIDIIVVFGIYIWFSFGYFVVDVVNEQLVLASLIFLYGLPTGTLLGEKIKHYFNTRRV